MFLSLKVEDVMGKITSEGYILKDILFPISKI